MNRKKEQAELLFKTGQFFGPVLQMVNNPLNYDREERVRITARFLAQKTEYVNVHVGAFVKGEPGHFYAEHWSDIDNMVGRFKDNVMFLNNANEDIDLLNAASCASGATLAIKSILNSIISVPIPIDSAIYEARTPFTTYCFVKDLCCTAGKQIVWQDRYFDQTIFHRFFTDAPKSTLITLITVPAASAQSPRDKVRVAEFMDVSRLFAAERGQQGYRLIEATSFHDRWLRCDDKLFTLGGSIKDLSQPFTISKLDFTPANVKHFDDAIGCGTEVFGPNQPNHP